MAQLRMVEVSIRDPGERKRVPIAADAGIATGGTADGRMIPLLILDTRERADIDALINAHEHTGPGDATTNWSQPWRLDRTKLRLVVQFTKPAHCLVIVEFDLETQGVLVDAIIHVQGLYLQGGLPGDRLRDTFDHPRVLIEVPSRAFLPMWDELLRASLRRRFRKLGHSRSDAKAITDHFIAEWRKLTSFRIRS